MSAAYRAAMIGTLQPVLFEEPDGEFFTGHAPNYVKIYAPGDHLHNRIRHVRITEVFRDGVRGTVES